MRAKPQVPLRQAPAIERSAYSPPTLKVFGPVGTLTQGGTGPMVEGGASMMGGGDMNPNQRP